MKKNRHRLRPDLDPALLWAWIIILIVFAVWILTLAPPPPYTTNRR